jgi:hypothetical protein
VHANFLVVILCIEFKMLWGLNAAHTALG